MCMTAVPLASVLPVSDHVLCAGGWVPSPSSLSGTPPHHGVHDPNVNSSRPGGVYAAGVAITVHCAGAPPSGPPA